MGARSPRGFKGRRISLAVATALHGRPLAAAPRLLPRARSSPHLLLGQAAAEAAPFASRAPAASALAAQLLWDLATLHTQAAAALFSLLCSARATRHVSYFLPPPRMVLTPVPPLAAPQPDTPASPDTGSSSSSELVSPGTNDRGAQSIARLPASLGQRPAAGFCSSFGSSRRCGRGDGLAPQALPLRVRAALAQGVGVSPPGVRIPGAHRRLGERAWPKEGGQAKGGNSAVKRMRRTAGRATRVPARVVTSVCPTSPSQCGTAPLRAHAARRERVATSCRRPLPVVRAFHHHRPLPRHHWHHHCFPVR